MKKLALNYERKLPYSVEEELNRLRVNFSFCGDHFKKVMITSSTADEGKSFITVNLWRMLAASGKKVVLVDADIRKSVLRHKITSEQGREGAFGGLSHYLAGQQDLDDVVYETNFPNAYMVPMTHSVTNPILLLQSVRFSEMLDELARVFDYVLVDTPPLALVADAGLVAAQCDGTVLVVNASDTPKGIIADSLKQIERTGCELMGVVLNKVNQAKSPYYQKYSKYGYYGDESGR